MIHAARFWEAFAVRAHLAPDELAVYRCREREVIPDSLLDWPAPEQLAETNVLYDLADLTCRYGPWEAASRKFNKINEGAPDVA